MQPLIEGWTVVLAGQWNVGLLHPVWVSNHVMQQPNVEVPVEYQLGPNQAQSRMIFDRHLILPRADRVVVGMKDDSETTAEEAEGIAKRLLDLLPHTPMVAIGANFSFVEKAPPGELLEVFALPDSAKLAEHGDLMPAVSLKRTIRHDDVDVRLEMSYGDGQVTFRLNFHNPASNAQEAKQAIDGKLVGWRAFAAETLTQVYDLTPDAHDDEQENEDE